METDSVERSESKRLWSQGAALLTQRFPSNRCKAVLVCGGETFQSKTTFSKELSNLVTSRSSKKESKSGALAEMLDIVSSCQVQAVKSLLWKCPPRTSKTVVSMAECQAKQSLAAYKLTIAAKSGDTAKLVWCPSCRFPPEIAGSEFFLELQGRGQQKPTSFGFKDPVSKSWIFSGTTDEKSDVFDLVSADPAVVSSFCVTLAARVPIETNTHEGKHTIASPVFPGTLRVAVGL